MFFMDISGDNRLVSCLGFLFVYFFHEDIISPLFFLFVNDKEVKFLLLCLHENIILNLSKRFRIFL